MAPKQTKTKGRPTASKAPAKSKDARKPAPKGTKPAKAGAASKKASASKKSPSKSAAEPKRGAQSKPKASAKVTKTTGRKGKTKAGAAAADEQELDADDSKRNFGLRGAAPWVARHAAKHAEELKKRNAEPPPPGSARATLRTPKAAEEIKGKIGLLHQRVSSINTLRKKLDKSFYEIGELLGEVQANQLFEAKGYATFESFLDREIELPRPQAIKLVRIVHTFDREAAQDYPLDRLMSALSALDGELVASPASQAAASSRTIVGSGRGFPSAPIPPRPPIRWD